MSISQNLAHIHQQIADFSQQAQRQAQSVHLLAVSKTKPCADILTAYQAGQRAFGENYVQEGVEKIQFFTPPLSADLTPAENANEQRQFSDMQWHFIGPLQSNKTRLVAEHFDWVQTIDRLKIAQRLSEQRPAEKAPLQVLIQINISQEQSKSGITPAEMLDLAKLIVKLPRLQLRGLMAIPEPDADLATYQQMQALFQQLQQQFPEQPIDTLSLGMSDDMQKAIQFGSTMVRIGTAIFGKRNYTNTCE